VTYLILSSHLNGIQVLNSDREHAEGNFQKPGKMGSEKERENV
jgi:hypothetical protein